MELVGHIPNTYRGIFNKTKAEDITSDNSQHPSLPPALDSFKK